MNTEFKVTSNLHGLARRLIAEGILDATAAEAAYAESTRKNKTLLAWLIKTRAADSDLIAAAAADEYGIPLIDIRAFDLSQAPLSLVSETLIEKHNILPLHLRGNQLFIGMTDPTDHEVIDEIAFSSGFHVEPILVAADQLGPAIDRAMEATSPAFDDFDDEDEGTWSITARGKIFEPSRRMTLAAHGACQKSMVYSKNRILKPMKRVDSDGVQALLEHS